MSHPLAAINPAIARIERELEALDPAPFRRVLARLLDSLESEPDEALRAMSPDKKVKAAKDMGMLIGYATPLVSVTHNHLHVEQLTDVQLLAERSKARAALDSVMARSLLEAQSVPAPAAPSPAQSGTGGLGEALGGKADAQGDPLEEKKIEITHATGIAPAPQPAPVGAATRGKRGRKPV